MSCIIIERIDEATQKKIRVMPCYANRASELGHPCERYLVFIRTRWQEKTLHSIGLQRVFDEGNLHEKDVMQKLKDANIVVIEQQRPYEWKQYNITGHIDGKILIGTDLPYYDKKLIPLEIKSASPYSFQKISDVNSLLNSKFWYMKKYPAQLNLYMLMAEENSSVMIFKNKVNGELKEVWCKLDYDYAEGLIKKAERINKHVAEETIPDCVWDDDICGDCGFRHICNVEVKRDALVIQDSKELEDKLNRRRELQLCVKEYDELDDEIKKQVKGQSKIVIGDFLITGKTIKKEMKTKEAYTQEFWQSKISYIGGK